MGLNKIVEYFKSKIHERQLKHRFEEKHYFRFNHTFTNHDIKTGTEMVMNSVFDEFAVPDNMGYEDAFKVISFLTEKVCTDLKVRHKSFDDIKLTNAILEKFHFEKPDFPVHKNDVVDLIVESGNCIYLPHQRSNVYLDDQEWYKYYIKQNEVKQIYDKLGLEVDFAPFDKSIKDHVKGPKYQQVVIDPRKNKTM